MESLLSPDIILASRSPRRHQILKEAGISFRIHAPQVEEVYPSSLPAAAVPQWLAALKAEEASLTYSQSLIIAADTIVILDGRILGKPEDKEEAKMMLEQISGKGHEVITGVQILSPEEQISFSVHTEVYFRDLDPDQIQYYIDLYSPMDKAGAYGIQEWIGMVGIEGIRGDFYNVMGLPIGELWRHLQSMGRSPTLGHRP